MFPLPITSDSTGIKVLVSREEDAFTKGPRRVLLGHFKILMEVDQQSQNEVTIPTGAVDPNPRWDIKLLQHNKTRKK